MSWSIINDEKELQKALKLCKGSYQEGLLQGYENLSGSSLRGYAKHWSSRYATSRRNLLERLEQNGIVFSEQRGDHNKRLLVIG